jgi:pimeloyl-ACP methyl ester carboxylesterase
VKSLITLGVNVAYSDNGSGPPVLLMHGNPDSRHSWEPLLASLGEGFRCIAPDFPGFGDSQPLPKGQGCDPSFMAKFWGSFVDGLGLAEPPHVVVHDFGGPWLLPWVVTSPTSVRSLFVLNTFFHCDFPWHPWARLWQTPILGELSLLLPTRMVLRREMRLHAPRVSRELVDATYARMHFTMRRTVLRVYREFSRPDLAFESWESRLVEAAKTLPVCVLWGDRDPYIPSGYAQRFGVQPTHVSDCGHWLHLEDPALVARHLRDFLSSQATG